MASGWAKCQELTLSAQLGGGIRFLDLRVMSDDKGEIWTHHNVMTCLNLKEILDIVKTFIVDHPTEIVGLFINNDSKHIDWSVCTGIINEYLGERLIHEHMREMLIGNGSSYLNVQLIYLSRAFCGIMVYCKQSYCRKDNFLMKIITNTVQYATLDFLWNV
jgi:hypothetical protein